jgi:hypothetical protein
VFFSPSQLTIPTVVVDDDTDPNATTDCMEPEPTLVKLVGDFEPMHGLRVFLNMCTSLIVYMCDELVRVADFVHDSKPILELITTTNGDNIDKVETASQDLFEEAIQIKIPAQIRVHKKWRSQDSGSGGASATIKNT